MKSNKAFPEQRDALDALEALDLAIKHIRGKGDKFSERNPTAVLSQLEGTRSRISHALTNPAVPEALEWGRTRAGRIFVGHNPRGEEGGFHVISWAPDWINLGAITQRLEDTSVGSGPKIPEQHDVRAIAQSGEGRAGWKLVPVEPTQEMIDAAQAEMDRNLPPHYPIHAYRRMLAAAPEPGPEKNDEKQ